MICSNCGKNNAEGSAFCEECGATLETVSSPAPEMPMGAPAEEPSMPGAASKLLGKIDKKIIIAVAGVVAVVLVLVLAITSCGGGYKKPIDQYFNALNKGKAETYVKILPKGQEKEWKKDDDQMDIIKDDLEAEKKVF